MKKKLLLIILSLFIISLIGCTKTTYSSTTESSQDPVYSSTTEDEKHIYTKEPYIELYVGEQKYLNITTDFEIPSSESLEFHSSDSSVVRVLSTGFIIAKSRGYASITVSYEDISLVIQVNCLQDFEFSSPEKLEYYVGDSLDLTGIELNSLNNDGSIKESITIDESMISGFDSSTQGKREVFVKYQDLSFSFFINVIEKELESYQMKEVVFEDNLVQNELLELNIIPNNLSKLKEAVSSFFDYSKLKILVTFEAPSGKQDTVYSFFYQDYTQKKTNVTLNKNATLEGIVNSRTGYNFKYTYTKNGDGYYKVRYIPRESGKYSYHIVVYAGGATIAQELDGELEVLSGTPTKGNIRVSANKKTFEFENGDSYLALGENVGWYTSSERRVGDYEIYFKELGSVGATYARVWLAAWGFSLFWDDVYDYSTRMDEAYELDQVFDLAKENGIYIDLSFFQHGMFSETVNPMWPNTNNTWYTGKYGANPYSKLFDSPGSFFTSTVAKKTAKNYMTYIVARYGYSENLLSYELFNEVDWIESYQAETGKNWHDEMAKHIKSVSYNNHLVTTSVKGDNFSSSIYQVFNLPSIDYVNVHNYGTKNYLTYIPKKVLQAYSRFDKPIMYQEVGYGGNGGSEQLEKDPNHVTLHQEIWAGLMSSGASGMNWWWDSWIEKANAYSFYKGLGEYIKHMDLSGSMSLVFETSDVSISNSKVTKLGYKFKNRAYIYLFDNENYIVGNSSRSISTNLTISNIENGTYKVEYFNTSTGGIIKTESLNASNSKLTISSISFSDDIALIITKK